MRYSAVGSLQIKIFATLMASLPALSCDAPLFLLNQ
jgi:hypothetical protein